MINRLKCIWYGHDWGIYRLFGEKGALFANPHQRISRCKRCGRTTKPEINEIEYNNSYLHSINNTLMSIDDKLKRDVSTKSKLIAIDDLTSIDIDSVQDLEKRNMAIIITMKSGKEFDILFTKKDWLKLHQLKK